MRRCEKCFGRHWRAKLKENGTQIKHNNGNLVYVCVRCGHVQEEDDHIIQIPQRIQANILYLDIETSKSLYYSYGAKVPSKYLRADDLVKEWFMICWSASYVGKDTVWSQSVTPQAARDWDDSKIVKRLWELMNAAEIISGHNVQGFDFKRCNTRFVKHGLPPIVGKKYLDTLKVVRSALALNHNNLDYVAKWYGMEGKEHVTDDDWRAALKGDKPTLDKILHYNITDVTEGKAVLEKTLPLFNKKFDFGSLKLSPAAIAELKPPKKNELK